MQSILQNREKMKFVSAMAASEGDHDNKGIP